MAIAKTDKIVITGGAGLVGLNLVVELAAAGFSNLVVIDKLGENVELLRQLAPSVRRVVADLAEPGGGWQSEFDGCACAVVLHAQITGLTSAPFLRNNIEATKIVIAELERRGVGYVVDISSSVVNSVADDDYTRTKKAQEALFAESHLKHCCLRPTLMFGWFDPKHLGWLARFMAKTPVFPIPGDGRYMRQPLYQRDFCRIIRRCIEEETTGTYDIVGDTKIDYIDIIRAIKQAKGLRTVILPIPFPIFEGLMRGYALFSKNPPFTASQLRALTAGDRFTGVDTERTFGVRQTPFEAAMRETHGHATYSSIVPAPTH
jgi:nucleoside-diphosphate-sugar epimerase